MKLKAVYSMIECNLLPVQFRRRCTDCRQCVTECERMSLGRDVTRSSSVVKVSAIRCCYAEPALSYFLYKRICCFMED